MRDDVAEETCFWPPPPILRGYELLGATLDGRHF
jgi:hypothetical protein